MTSSGTYSFSLSNGGVVLAAFERVRVRAPELRIEHFQTAGREINLLFSGWSNEGVNLWKVDLQSVPMINAQATYSVPANTVMILDAWISTTNGSSTNDRYITPISRTDYASFANKLTPGAPTSYWFDRLINPTITMWPVPNQSSVYTLNYYRFTQMQDANLPSGETPDIPYRWLDALVAGLAYRLSRTYAPDLEDKREKNAREAWLIAAAQDTENTNLSLSPPIGSYYRR